MASDPLLVRAHTLDAQALAAIHDQYYPVVFRYVRYRLDDLDIVEDIASEVFLRWLDAMHKHKEIREVRAWLLGTASHLIQDHLRQKYRHPVAPLENESGFASQERPEADAESRLQHRQVREALHRLTEEQQHTLALRFSQDFSLEETAHILGKSVNAVKVLQFRAIASLRRILEENQ